MENKNKKCEVCGEILKPSQYLSRKLEGQSVEEKLVCRNYPDCPKAEKEIDDKNL